MSVDEFMFRAVNGWAGESAVLDRLARALSNPDVLWAPGVLLAGYWLWRSRREAILAAPLLAASIGLLDFVGAQLKDLVARPRPCMALVDVRHVEACGKAFGFPSNHAVNTAAAAAFLQVLYPRSGWISWPLVFLIGLSRVYLGAHYVTDVVGGWLIGGLLGGGIAWGLTRWRTFGRLRGSPDSPRAERSALSP
jgi:undecaprenyl-diphosphatase